MQYTIFFLLPSVFFSLLLHNMNPIVCPFFFLIYIYIYMYYIYIYIYSYISGEIVWWSKARFCLCANIDLEIENTRTQASFVSRQQRSLIYMLQVFCKNHFIIIVWSMKIKNENALKRNWYSLECFLNLICISVENRWRRLPIGSRNIR